MNLKDALVRRLNYNRVSNTVYKEVLVRILKSSLQ